MGGIAAWGTAAVTVILIVAWGAASVLEVAGWTAVTISVTVAIVSSAIVSWGIVAVVCGCGWWWCGCCLSGGGGASGGVGTSCWAIASCHPCWLI